MKSPSSEEMRRMLEARPEFVHMAFVLVVLALLHKKARGWIILACVACAVFSWFVPWLALLAFAVALYLVFPNQVIGAVGYVWRSFL